MLSTQLADISHPLCASLPSRSDSELTQSEDQNHVQVPRDSVPETNGQGDATQRLSPSPAGARHQMNGGANTPTEARAPPSRLPEHDSRTGVPHRPQQPNGWGSYGAPGSPAYPLHAQQQQEAQRPESVVLRRSIAPRTDPEKQAQRKSSMTQLQQWVNQRRGLSAQEDLRR